MTKEKRSGRPARHEGPFAAVTITLPISLIDKIERERTEAGDADPGRSGFIASILHDRYERREKELAGAA